MVIGVHLLGCSCKEHTKDHAGDPTYWWTANPTTPWDSVRLAAALERIESECREHGIPFRVPSKTPNTRLVLELAEVVRVAHPDRFTRFDDALFEARFVQDLDLSDPAVLAQLLTELDIDPTVLDAARAGAGRVAVDRSMEQAREYGIAATPSWRFPNGFVIPGVHPSAQVRRWVTRIIERSEGVSRIVSDG